MATATDSPVNFLDYSITSAVTVLIHSHYGRALLGTRIDLLLDFLCLESFIADQIFLYFVWRSQVVQLGRFGELDGVLDLVGYNSERYKWYKNVKLIKAHQQCKYAN